MAHKEIIELSDDRLMEFILFLHREQGYKFDEIKHFLYLSCDGESNSLERFFKVMGEATEIEIPEAFKKFGGL